MLTAAVLAAALATTTPAFCAHPDRPVDVVVCADPEARRLAGVTAQVIDELWKTETGRAIVGEADEQADYVAKRERCTTLACAREAYRDRLAALVERYYDGDALPFRGGQGFRAPADPRGWRNLMVKDLGDGWIFVWIDVGLSHGPADLPSDWRNWASAVVRLKNGRASLSTTADETVEIERSGRGWRVRQTPECSFIVCESLSGEYRPTRRRFWEHP